MNPYKPAPEIFKDPVCSCGTPWKKICSRCNIAFCGDHVDPDKHSCRPDEVRPYPRKEEEAPKSQEPRDAKSEKPVQTELFPHGPNGKAR